MSLDDPRIDRLHELLADRALQGLGEEERRELERLTLDPEFDGIVLDLAAAELELAGLAPTLEDLPASLWGRLEADADPFFDPPMIRVPARSMAGKTLPWLGWVAAAASLVYAARVDQGPPKAPAPTRPPTLVERLANVPRRPLGATDHPLARGGGGTLVWSGERQEGYLEVRGLAEVEPKQGIYQLWIFDATRDDRFPIDGGTFVVKDPKATTLVPIQPSLAVRSPTFFAVTLEPPGGVVVSDRKRIVLTATPPP